MDFWLLFFLLEQIGAQEFSRHIFAMVCHSYKSLLGFLHVIHIWLFIELLFCLEMTGFFIWWLNELLNRPGFAITNMYFYYYTTSPFFAKHQLHWLKVLEKCLNSTPTNLYEYFILLKMRNKYNQFIIEADNFSIIIILN